MSLIIIAVDLFDYRLLEDRVDTRLVQTLNAVWINSPSKNLTEPFTFRFNSWQEIVTTLNNRFTTLVGEIRIRTMYKDSFY